MFFARLALIVGACSVFSTALAQSYPTKPVRIITGDVGNFVDVVARRIGSSLAERWSQSVVVDNRPGAGLTIGTAAAARSPADGYTILLSDRTALSVAPSLYTSLSYDPSRDLAPITLVATTPLMLVAHSSVPAGNLGEFIQYLKREPVTDFFTSGGATGNHLANEVLKQVAGVNIVNVHYKGSPPAVAGLLAGETRGGFMLVPVILPHVKSGRVKAYAITSGKRFAGTPDIPSVAELGMPGLEAEYWIAIMAPAGTPQPILGKLNRDIVEIMKTSAMREFLIAQGAEPAYGAPNELSALMSSESAKWKKVIDAAGIRLE
jgi:tripartite-type tricarboxylate transporter receptor subunit TctC